MKARLSALTLFFVGAWATPAQDDAAKKELARMQGEWRPVRAEEAGEAVPDRAIEPLRCVIQGNMLTFAGIEPLTDRASKLTIKLYADSMPRCIDLDVQVGSEKGRVLEGVYEWKGDELWMCLQMPGGVRNRPLEFDSKGDANRILVVWRRSKS